MAVDYNTINRTLSDMKTQAEGIKTSLGQFQGSDIASPNVGLERSLSDISGALATTIGDQSAQQKTIAQQYAERKALAEQGATAQEELIKSQAGTSIEAAKEQGQRELTSELESRRGFATNTALMKQIEDTGRKRVLDLEKTRDELLLQNKANEASRLDNLIIAEQESTTKARTDYLDTLFKTSSELRSIAGFETPEQQQQRSLKTAEQQAVMNLMTTAPDAGITDKDNLEAATTKYRNSEVYKQNIAKGEADIASVKASTAKTNAELTTSTSGTYIPGANASVDSWISRINNGTAKLSDITGAGSAAIKNQVIQGLDSVAGKISDMGLTDLQTSAYLSAKDLLDKYAKGGSGAVGGSGFLNSFGFGLIPGTAIADFKNKFKTLIAQLALDNVKYLKGQGQISDSERKILSEASTALNLQQSDAEFKKTLQGIIKTFEDVGKKNLQERNSTETGNRSLGTIDQANNGLLGGSIYKGFSLPY